MMRSTFATFTTAQLGMAASQRAIDVTGQNIANINTEGYTKQRLDIASLNMKYGSMYSSSNNIRVGFGVDMTAVSQLRDPFLDAQYRSQIASLGTTDAHAAGLEKLQVPFDESTTSGIRDAFINLSNALQTLSKDDGYTKENDTVVRSRMQIIVNLLREKAVNLQDIREDTQVNFQATDIRELNETLKNIGELNTSIKDSQILGNPALELMDERNRLLDELGSYLPINVNYKQRTIGEGYSVQVLDVTFRDSEGVNHRLISDGRYSEFRADISGEPVALVLTDADGYTVDVTNTLTEGTVKGTLDFMNKSGDFDDTDFKGIGYYEKVLDSLVAKFATEFNKANKTTEQETVNGKDANNKDVKYYKYESIDNGTTSTVYKGEDGKYYKDTNGTPHTVGASEILKPVYKPDKPVTVTKNGNTYNKLEDSIGTTVFESGGKYYLADSKGEPSANEYKGSTADLTTVYESDRPLFEKIDNSKGFSALNIKIASSWIDGTYGITNSNNQVNGVIGSTANENIENMISMLSKEYTFTSVATGGAAEGSDVRFFTGSFYNCFANIESTLGIDISSASTMLDNQITVLNQTANSRDAISGVQLDEEGMDLLHYNQSYSAAARLMTTLDEMLDKLINGTGVVGR